MSVVYHNIPPVFDKNSNILILGSFPSIKSREGEFFYNHPQNRFWKVISSVFDSDIPVNVEEKKRFLLDNNIALWDVIESCELTGSDDSSIKNAKANDISVILDSCDIRNIYVNGGKAFELYKKLCFPHTGRDAIKLPSTSPANASYSVNKLIACWKIIKQ